MALACVRLGFAVRSAPRDRFVQIQNHSGHGGPCRQLGRVDAGRRRSVAYAEQFLGGRGVGHILLMMLAIKRDEDAAFFGRCRARESARRNAQSTRSAGCRAPIASRFRRRIRGPLRHTSDRSIAPAIAAACSIACGRRCILRASARRTLSGSGARTSAATRCIARGDIRSRRDRPSICGPGKFR